MQILDIMSGAQYLSLFWWSPICSVERQWLSHERKLWIAAGSAQVDGIKDNTISTWLGTEGVSMYTSQGESGHHSVTGNIGTTGIIWIFWFYYSWMEDKNMLIIFAHLNCTLW